MAKRPRRDALRHLQAVSAGSKASLSRVLKALREDPELAESALQLPESRWVQSEASRDLLALSNGGGRLIIQDQGLPVIRCIRLSVSAVTLLSLRSILSHPHTPI